MRILKEVLKYDIFLRVLLRYLERKKKKKKYSNSVKRPGRALVFFFFAPFAASDISVVASPALLLQPLEDRKPNDYCCIGL